MVYSTLVHKVDPSSDKKMHTKQVELPQHTGYFTIPEGSLYSQFPIPTTSNICLISVAASHLILLQSFTEKGTECGLVRFTQHVCVTVTFITYWLLLFTAKLYSHVCPSPWMDTELLQSPAIWISHYKHTHTKTRGHIDIYLHPQRHAEEYAKCLLHYQMLSKKLQTCQVCPCLWLPLFPCTGYGLFLL